MVPREHLTRTMPFRMADDQAAGDGLTLEGYAATFDQPTRIDSWEGAFNEKIRRGAFRKSIRERTPRMQFEHGKHPLIGSIPIGAIRELREDDAGLWTSARLSDNWLIQPVRDAIADGAIDGMSFRFSVIREEWRDVEGKRLRDDEIDALLWNPGERGPIERTLVEVKLHELGPVVWPAYDSTSVGVRARTLAESIRSDNGLRRRVRESLAYTGATLAQLDDDPALRREVARAVLLDVPHLDQHQHQDDHRERVDDQAHDDDHDDQAHRDASPDSGHPSPTRHDDQDAPHDQGHATSTTSTTDAPPAVGHPLAMSTRLNPARVRRDAQMRAEYLSLIVKGSARYDERSH